MPPVQCWCEDPIPPYSLFFAKCLMEPVPEKEPIFVVTRCGLKEGTPTGAEESMSVGLRDAQWNTLAAYFSTSVPYAGFPDEMNFTPVRAGPWILANGSTAIPARVVFPARSPFSELCWISYRNYGTVYTAANSLYFIPRDDSWAIVPVGSTMPITVYPAGNDSPRDYASGLFRRWGPPNVAREIVPVYAVDSLAKWNV